MNARWIYRMLSVVCIVALCMIGSQEDYSALATAPTTLYLDGSKYLEAPNHPSLNPPMGITVEAWVKLPADSTSDMTIISKDYTTSYWLGLSNRYPRFYSSWGRHGGQCEDRRCRLVNGRTWRHVRRHNPQNLHERQAAW